MNVMFKKSKLGVLFFSVVGGTLILFFSSPVLAFDWDQFLKTQKCATFQQKINNTNQFPLSDLQKITFLQLWSIKACMAAQTFLIDSHERTMDLDHNDFLDFFNYMQSPRLNYYYWKPVRLNKNNQFPMESLISDENKRSASRSDLPIVMGFRRVVGESLNKSPKTSIIEPFLGRLIDNSGESLTLLICTQVSCNYWYIDKRSVDALYLFEPLLTGDVERNQSDLIMRMFDDIDKDGLQTSVRNIIYLGLMKRGHAMEELTSLFAVLSDIQFNPFLNESVASSIPANARRGYHHLFDGFFIISVWNEKLKQLTLDTGFVDQQVSNWDKWVNNKDFLSVHSGETNLIVELKKYPFVTSPQSKTQLKIEGQKVFIYPYK